MKGCSCDSLDSYMIPSGRYGDYSIMKRTLPLILALLLAAMSSCTHEQSVETDKQIEKNETIVTPSEANDENKNPNILTNVYTESELTFDSEIAPLFNSKADVSGGKVSIISTKDARVDDTYVTEYYLTTFDLEAGVRDDRKLSIDDDGFFPGQTLITEDAVYITNTIFDSITGSNTIELIKYNLTDDSTTVLSGIENLLPQSPQERTPRVTGIARDKDGCIYLKNNNSVCVLNPDLTKMFDCTTDDFIRSMAAAPSGEVYVTGFGVAYPVDKTGKAFGSPIQLPEDTDAEYFYFGEGYDCYFTDRTGLYGYNFNSNKADIIINWQNSNINYSTVQSINVLSADKVFIQYSEQSENGLDYHYSIFNKSDDIDISDKTVVTTAYFNNMLSDFPQYMVNYNKTHPDVYISGEDYSAYSSGDDRGASTKLISEMLTGIHTPDIICVEYGFSEEQTDIILKVLENELYTDMYSFMENDPDIKRDDVMGAVKNTFEVDGKLALVMPSFNLKTIIAPKSEVGEMTSWNYEQILSFMDKLPEGKKLSSDSFSTLDFNNAFDVFIDYNNKTCDFNNSTCIGLIEKYAELEKYNVSAGQFMINDAMMEPGIPVCCEREYSNVDSYQADEALLQTKDFVRIGYPTEKGSGSTVSSGRVYIIPKNAAHPKEAWDFIRSMIMEKPEYDAMARSGIRMLRSQNEAYEEDMQKYFKFFPLNMGRYSFSSVSVTRRDGYLDENGLHNGEAGTLVEFVKEDFEAFLDFIDSAGSPVTEKIPDEIHDIIFEEIDAYKNGDRTAEKTAEILQSRISIYLSERE